MIHRTLGRLAPATLALAGMLVAAPAAAMADPGPDAPPANRIEVDLSERELYVYSNGERINTFPVAIGEEGNRTPTGSMEIDRVIWNPDWVPPQEEWAEDAERKAPGDPDNPMQGAKIFFQYPDYYIHGTNAPGTLGEAASHGCIRMREVDAENLAEWVQKVGGESRSEGWFEQVRSSETDMREITLSDPIPIEIHW